MSVFAGLATGCGVVYLMDFLDSRVYRAEDIEFLEIPLLAIIPAISSGRRKAFGWINTCATIISVILASFLVAALAAMALSGVKPTMAIIKKFIAI
jgi:hypothetical protein